jgi:dUTP diphosphatase
VHPKVKAKVKILDPRAEKYLPKYGSELASGFDLHALEDVSLGPHETVMIKTGLAIQVPEGYEIQVRPRSGMSLKTFFRVANSPGTVDADYRGDLSVIGHNVGNNPFIHMVEIKAGDRIAQAVIVPVFQADFEVVNELDDSKRGTAGFGSTGK